MWNIYIYIFIGFLCDKVYVIKNLEAQLICNMHVSAINKLAIHRKHYAPPPLLRTNNLSYHINRRSPINNDFIWYVSCMFDARPFNTHSLLIYILFSKYKHNHYLYIYNKNQIFYTTLIYEQRKIYGLFYFVF